MLFYNDFLGSDLSNVTSDFIAGDDDMEKYLDNLDRQPEDWIYRYTRVNYSFNEYGHRCKSIKDIDLDNYILFAGCSHTVGIGVPLERSFPYIVSQHVLNGCDYYNLGVSGIGLDTLEYNLLTWFTKIEKKPKLVIIQWPDHSRFISIEPGRREVVPTGSWTSNFDAQKFIIHSENTACVQGRKAISYKLIKEIIDVPILSIMHKGLVPYDENSIIFYDIDRARDLIHGGLDTQSMIADKILNEYVKTYKNYIEFYK